MCGVWGYILIVASGAEGEGITGGHGAPAQRRNAGGGGGTGRLLGRRSSRWSRMTRADSNTEYRAHIPVRQANKALRKAQCPRRREFASL
jgi:hypothetical protein